MGSYIKDVRKILPIFDPPPPLVRIQPTPLPPDVWRPQSTSIKGKNFYNVVNFLRDSRHLATSSNNIHAFISCLGDGMHSKPTQFFIMA